MMEGLKGKETVPSEGKVVFYVAREKSQKWGWNGFCQGRSSEAISCDGGAARRKMDSLTSWNESTVIKLFIFVAFYLDREEERSWTASEERSREEEGGQKAGRAVAGLKWTSNLVCSIRNWSLDIIVGSYAACEQMWGGWCELIEFLSSLHSAQLGHLFSQGKGWIEFHPQLRQSWFQYDWYSIQNRNRSKSRAADFFIHRQSSSTFTEPCKSTRELLKRISNFNSTRWIGIDIQVWINSIQFILLRIASVNLSIFCLT